jgi:hypothetical protein
MLARPINSSAFTVYNSSASIPASDMTLLISAMNIELAALSKVWGRTQIPVMAGAGSPPVEQTPMNAWPIYIVDSLDSGVPAGTLGLHDVKSGIPYARVFVDEIRKVGGVNLYKDTNTITVASVVFHQLLEMYGDCFANGWSQDGNGDFWALELADAVESNIILTNASTMKKVDNKIETILTPVGLCDYVYPAWFNSHNTTGPYNRAGNLTKPFQVDKHGYAIIYNGHSYSSIYGSNVTDATKYKAFADLTSMKYPSLKV